MNGSKKITVSLPDGTKKKFTRGLSGYDLAKTISKSLSKQAVAIKIDGVQKDLTDQILKDCEVCLITVNSEEGLEIMRHTVAAQVLARAIKNLYPKAKLAIGPTIENGFYYDVMFEKPISFEDLELIEKEMKIVALEKACIHKTLHTKQEAISLFRDKNEDYKIKIIEESKQTESFQIYTQGDSQFIDLCHGPHLPTLAQVGAFKLTKLSGAYWRGDSQNEMLQRIYGTAWKNENELNKYLLMIEEAEKRDHRKLGKDLDLFHFQEHAAGSVFWHEKGWRIYRKIMHYMRGKLEKNGYHEVNTPQLVDRSLWKKSGHWEKFREYMFTCESEEKTLAIKPMNCPCHVQIFRQGVKSYKELPIRMAEFGSCHRNEPSGALHGLMRIRAFTQDDAHIFCTKEQIVSETEKFCKFLMEVYRDFGFEEVTIKFADRPENRAGEDQVWDQAENALREAINEAGYSYELNKGEGAFYGPKLEFVLKDAIGRDWQCGTLQVDFVLPDRLDASYVGEDGQKYRPVILHRAVLGSFERFIGILIENYSGKLPHWLAPTQVALININDDCLDYIKLINDELKLIGIDTVVDDRKEKINYKIREHAMNKIPYIVVAGHKEIETQTVSLRTLGNKDQEVINLKDFLKKIKNSCSIPENMSN